jgi:ATP-dependent Zn protease
MVMQYGMSEKTAQLIDEAMAKLINEAGMRVMHTLNERQTNLDQLATMLLQQEVVNREQLTELRPRISVKQA